MNIDWKNVSPGIDTGSYDGFFITRMWEEKDIYNVNHYTYVAVKGTTKFVEKDLDSIHGRIIRHNYIQASLF